MEIEWKFELNLNYLTGIEHAQNPLFFQSEYLDYVLEMLAYTGRLHIFKEDLLNKFEGKTLVEILEAHPFLIQVGDQKPNPHQGGRLSPVYYNVNMCMAITSQHLHYDYFVATLIKQIDIMYIDVLLEYAMMNNDNFSLFARFMNLIIRKYHWVIQEQDILTIREWIEAKEKKFLKEDQFWDLKFKSKRTLNTKEKTLNAKEIILNTKEQIPTKEITLDTNETVLNQSQVVLLICYMQKAKIFLNDTSLTSSDAARCFKLDNPRLIPDDTIIELEIAIGTMRNMPANTYLYAGLHGTATIP